MPLALFHASLDLSVAEAIAALFLQDAGLSLLSMMQGG